MRGSRPSGSGALLRRIEAGEIVSVPLCRRGRVRIRARAKVEQAKADKLAELRAAGDQREVVFAVQLVVDRRVQARGSDRPCVEAERAAIPAEVASSDAAATSTEEEAVREEPQPPVIETYVQVQIRQCQDDDDPGEIAEGWFSIDGKVVTVTDANGRYVGSRAMLEGEDARVVAKQLLREKEGPGEREL